MRLSNEHLDLIKRREASGYVWLSHLSPRAQMRFRDRTKRGYNKFEKEAGLTFLTKEVAEFLEKTSRSSKEPRVKVSEQVKLAEESLAEASVKLMKAGHTIEVLHEIVVQFILAMHDGEKLAKWKIEEGKVTIEGKTLYLGTEAIEMLMAMIRGDRVNGVPVPLLH